MIKYNIYTERYHRFEPEHFPTDTEQIAIRLQMDGALCPRLRESYDNPIDALYSFRKNWKGRGKTILGPYDVLIEFAYLAIEYEKPDEDYDGWHFGWLDWAIQEPEKEEVEPEELPTYPEIRTDGRYRLHHNAWGKGYVSRKLTEAEFPVEPYKGRFGKGYKVKKPNRNSTTYCVIEYWIEK